MSFLHTISLGLAFAFTAIGSSAQQNIIYFDDANPATGGANAFPFGSVGVRTQQRIPGSVIGGPALIQDLFVAPALDRNGLYQESEVVYSDIEIRMGAFAGGSLTTNWATNLPTPTTVYRGPLRVLFSRDQWSPLGLPNAFAWAPSSAADDLVIDFILWGTSDTGAVPPDVNGYFLLVHSGTAGGTQRAYRRGWTAGQAATAAGVDTNGVKLGLLLGDGNFVAHGNECLGSSGLAPQIGSPAGVWPQLGGQLAVNLSAGPLASIAVLYLGNSDRVWAGIPLPFDLGSLGAAGCQVWHDPQVLLAATGTDNTGSAALSFPIPNQANLFGRRFYTSWYCVDLAANTLGVTTSGYATLIVGS